MKSLMVIKWHGYAADSKYCPISKVLHYFEEERKNVIVRLDYRDYNSNGWANFEEVDIIIPKIKISNLAFKTIRLDRYNSDNYAIFNCDMLMQKYLLKMFYLLSKLGDPGHSFNWKVDDIETGWDGDGSDRIIAINGDEKWKEKAFTKYNDGTKSEHIENLSELINFNKIYKEIKDSYPAEERFRVDDEIREKALEKVVEYEKQLKQEILNLEDKYTEEDEKRDKAEEKERIKQIKAEREAQQQQKKPMSESYKKNLYESIMKNIAKEVKKALND